MSGYELTGTCAIRTGIIRQPPHGEKRYVHLDPADGKFGFRLQVRFQAKSGGCVTNVCMCVHACRAMDVFENKARSCRRSFRA